MINWFTHVYIPEHPVQALINMAFCMYVIAGVIAGIVSE